MKLLKPLILLIVIMSFTGCAESPVEDSRPVKMAKACERAREGNPAVIEGFKISACTNNGIWLVTQLDETGNAYKTFDFVNQEYAGPESQGTLVPVGDLGMDAPMRFQTIRQTLNEKLIEPPS